jgi:hypothetical protein
MNSRTSEGQWSLPTLAGGHHEHTKKTSTTRRTSRPYLLCEILQETKISFKTSNLPSRRQGLLGLEVPQERFYFTCLRALFTMSLLIPGLTIYGDALMSWVRLQNRLDHVVVVLARTYRILYGGFWNPPRRAHHGHSRAKATGFRSQPA